MLTNKTRNDIQKECLEKLKLKENKGNWQDYLSCLIH